jgi:hypothetical protein
MVLVGESYISLNVGRIPRRPIDTMGQPIQAIDVAVWGCFQKLLAQFFWFSYFHFLTDFRFHFFFFFLFCFYF